MGPCSPKHPNDMFDSWFETCYQSSSNCVVYLCGENDLFCPNATAGSAEPEIGSQIGRLRSERVNLAWIFAASSESRLPNAMLLLHSATVWTPFYGWCLNSYAMLKHCIIAALSLALTRFGAGMSHCAQTWYRILNHIYDIRGPEPWYHKSNIWYYTHMIS